MKPDADAGGRPSTGSIRHRPNGTIVVEFRGRIRAREVFAADEMALAERWRKQAVEAIKHNLAVPLVDRGTPAFAPIGERFTAAQRDCLAWEDAFSAWWTHKVYEQREVAPERGDALASYQRLHISTFMRTVAGISTAQEWNGRTVECFATWLVGLMADNQEPISSVILAERGDMTMTAKQLAALSKDPRLKTVNANRIAKYHSQGRLEPVDDYAEPLEYWLADALVPGLLLPDAPGVSRGVASDILRVVQDVLDYARGHGVKDLADIPSKFWTPPRVHREEPLRAPSNATYTWQQIRDVASLLGISHQITLWLIACTACRRSEPFGFRVADFSDCTDDSLRATGVGGLLSVSRQAGRTFKIHGPALGEVIRTPEKSLKTTMSARPIPVPEPVAALIRDVIRIFHTNPATGEIDLLAPLIPGINSPQAKSASFANALTAAAAQAGLPDLTPKGLRKRLSSLLTDTGLTERWAVRRWLGHVLGNDVQARHYYEDSELTQQMILTAYLGEQLAKALPNGLLAPTRVRHIVTGERRQQWQRWDVELEAIGLLTDAGAAQGRLSVEEAAARAGYSLTGFRNLCRQGALPTVRERVGGHLRWLVTEEALDEFIVKMTDRRNLTDIAADVGCDYHWARTRIRQHEGVAKAGRELTLTSEAEQAVRDLWARQRRIDGRSVLVSEAAAMLGRSADVVRSYLAEGTLVRDAESSRHVTKSSLTALQAVPASRVRLYRKGWRTLSASGVDPRDLPQLQQGGLVQVRRVGQERWVRPVHATSAVGHDASVVGAV